MPRPDPQKHPLSTFFLSGYLQKRSSDEENFPSNDEGVFDRYELVFGEALPVLGITKEALRAKSEFNFDSGDISRLEAGIATLRVVNAMRLMGHTEIALIKPPKDGSGADLVSEKGGKMLAPVLNGASFAGLGVSHMAGQ